MTELFYEFIFDAAHQFSHKPIGHKYRALHGHSFRAEVAVRGEPQADTGFIVDFETLEKACAKLHETLDHNFLNEIPGLERKVVCSPGFLFACANDEQAKGLDIG